MSSRWIPVLALLLLLPASAAPPASAESDGGLACTLHATWVWQCLGAGDGCGVQVSGRVVATCTPECVTPTCADPGFCDAAACVPDVPVCWNGAPLYDGRLHSSPACWAGAGTKPCGDHAGHEALYAHVLVYGAGVGCIPSGLLP